MADRFISAEEIARHQAESDCWLTIHGKVYDVTKYLVEHPGGLDVMMEHAGALSIRLFLLLAFV